MSRPQLAFEYSSEIGGPPTDGKDLTRFSLSLPYWYITCKSSREFVKKKKIQGLSKTFFKDLKYFEDQNLPITQVNI